MKLSKTQLLDLQQTAIHAATEAGRFIQSKFEQSYVQKVKAGNSPASQVVTEVDVKAQEIILRHLEPSIKQFDLGLLTEEQEGDQSRFEKDYFWCVDPMDGTLPFTQHRPGYSVAVALVTKSGNPLIGVVYVPDQAEYYAATKGEGVIRNGAPFSREYLPVDQKLHFFMDDSFQKAPYYASSKVLITEYAKQNGMELEINAGFGGVRNAIGVMTSGLGCYFKFPKGENGGGSIWDYAATRLLLEESHLCVSNAHGAALHLNERQNSFMNRQGVVFATDQSLADFIVKIGKDLA